MTNLTKKEFEHLQNLCNIKISDWSKEIFFDKLESVIQKLDELDNIDMSSISDKNLFVDSTENTLRVLNSDQKFSSQKEILKNSKHENINNSIVIRSVLW